MSVSQSTTNERRQQGEKLLDEAFDRINRAAIIDADRRNAEHLRMVSSKKVEVDWERLRMN